MLEFEEMFTLPYFLDVTVQKFFFQWSDVVLGIQIGIAHLFVGHSKGLSNVFK